VSLLNIFISITTGEFSEKCHAMYRAHGLEVMLSALGKGTADSKLFDYLGLETSDKLLQMLPVTEESGRELLREFRRAVHYEKRGSGIAFILPISSVGGKTILEYMIGGQTMGEALENKNRKQSEQRNNKGEAKAQQKAIRFDLLIAVCNQGYAEEVMQAARKAGAGGGTIVHAKGTANQYSEKFFGITLSEEKEIVLIVTRNTDRDRIMGAIKTEAGVATDAHTIVFSLPVENVAGIASYE